MTIERATAANRESSPFAAIVDALSAANEVTSEDGEGRRAPLPSRDAIGSIVSDLRSVLFPRHLGAYDPATSLRSHLATRLERIERSLGEQLERSYAFACDHVGEERVCDDCLHRARAASGSLIASLPRLRALLETDIRAAYEGDPAATSLDETLFCYPGVTAIIQHRIAHELYVAGAPLVPRIIAELAHSATGIDIHPGAEIGPSFFIDHGTGVVIGQTCAIGTRVRIYQGVTLGARGFPAHDDGLLVKGEPRHPIVGDDVVIFAGATILGRITIGRGATIGGNVWLTRSVDPGARVTQAQVRQEAFEAGSGI